MSDLGKAYVQIVPSAQGISGSISSLLDGESKSAGNLAGLNIVGALKGVIGAAAIGKFLADSITTGAEFDQSMSQVAATMGLTMDEMANQVGTVDLAWGEFSGNLREYAQEMGANTAFSASQASDALNYMALAGYDVQTSMEMLPNVLNLAAAGSMDLALASDMVTDTQTALGLSTERTSQLVDEMAKTASTTNTSVSQLGDAMLTIGATARNLSGGFLALESGEVLAYDGTQSLSMALGVLADNGIKGSEGGTHLRNMIMSLTSPTDKAAKAMDGLGLEVYDAEGNMRPFISILADMNLAMDEMTDAEKTDIISTIFNKTDIASVNALLATSEDRWLEVGSAILDAEGAAQQMADTQLDNLAGDVTLFKSALEGVKIALSDLVTPALREVVSLGSELMSAITTALTEGDMSGLSELGNKIIQMVADGIAAAPDKYLMIAHMVEGMLLSIVDALPGLLETGSEIVNGVISGVSEKLPDLLNEGVEIVTNITNGVTENLPEILAKGVEIVSNIANGILNNLPELITTAGNMLTTFVTFVLQNMPTILQAGVTLLQNLVNGIISNLPQIISSVVSVISTFISTIGQNLPQILNQGIQIIGQLVVGLLQAIPQIISAMPEIISSIIGAFEEIDWGEIGMNLIQGIANGITSAAGWIVDAAIDAAEAAFDAACSWLGINSPSKKGIWMGDMYVEGMAKGIKDNMDTLTDATDDLMDDTFGELTVPQASFNLAQSGRTDGNVTINMTINGAEGQDVNALAEIIQNRINDAVYQRRSVYA